MAGEEELKPEESLRHLESGVAQFTALLADGDLAAPVPSCPGWTLTNLAHHLSGVHRWARRAVVEGPPGPDDDPVGPSERARLVAWFGDGASDLVSALRKAGPEAECWTFGLPPMTTAFWFRRQAHETAMHLGDARASQGAPSEYDEGLALDGIDEVATMFLPRQVRLGRIPAPSTAVAVAPDGCDARWTLGEGTPAATLRGDARALLLLVWKRIALPDPRIAVEGDAAAALLAAAITP